MRALVTTLLLMSVATVSAANEFEQRRATCVPLVTAIYDDCSIHNFRRCADGGIYTEALMPDLPGIGMLYDADFQLVYQRSLIGGPGIDSVVEVRDPFSMTSLLSSGTDEQDITVNSSMAGFSQNVPLRSTTSATDDIYIVAERRLQVFAFTMTLEMGFAGNQMFVAGQGYYDPASELFFSGPASYTFNGSTLWDSPELIDIVDERSPSFMTQFPEETCQEQLSNLTPDPALRVETTHDNL